MNRRKQNSKKSRRKTKVRYWYIPENVYGVPINLIITPSKAAGQEWMRKNYCLEGEKADLSFMGELGVGSFFWDKGVKDTVIWLKDGDDITCLAHELAHYTIAVLEHRGVPITEATSEAFTYLQQGMFIACLDALGKRKLCGHEHTFH